LFSQVSIDRWRAENIAVTRSRVHHNKYNINHKHLFYTTLDVAHCIPHYRGYLDYRQYSLKKITIHTITFFVVFVVSFIFSIKPLAGTLFKCCAVQRHFGKQDLYICCVWAYFRMPHYFRSNKTCYLFTKNLT
jgi:hypothetical protein